MDNRLSDHTSDHFESPYNDMLVKQARLYKALAHPARLAILQYLSKIKTCMTGDIADELPISRTTVNQHLKELRDAGLIKGTVNGVRTNYCLNTSEIIKLRSVCDDFLNDLGTGENIC